MLRNLAFLHIFFGLVIACGPKDPPITTTATDSATTETSTAAATDTSSDSGLTGCLTTGGCGTITGGDTVVTSDTFGTFDCAVETAGCTLSSTITLSDPNTDPSDPTLTGCVPAVETIGCTSVPETSTETDTDTDSGTDTDGDTFGTGCAVETAGCTTFTTGTDTDSTTCAGSGTC
jgi:hypothetical protein